MAKHQFLLFLFTLFVLIDLRADESFRRWEVIELSFTASKKYDNPYQLLSTRNGEGMLKAEFTGVSGDALGETVIIFGFWDGGQQWMLRFAAPKTGIWKYKTISRDKGLNNKQGKFTVVDWTDQQKDHVPVRRGFVQVMTAGPQPGRFFQYADGTPFLWVADTWWNWTNRRIRFSSFKALVDDRAEKGFTVGQLFVAANGWGAESSMLDETYSKVDIDHMKKIDSMIVYANSKGITMWVHAWWSRERLDTTAGAEKIKRWWKYLVHRLAAYNVIWVVGGEYNMYNYGGLGLAFWKDLGQLIKNEDPYDRIVGIHNTPPGWDGGNDAPQWSTAEILHNEAWLDYNQSQVGHGRWRNEMIPDIVKASHAKTPAKPIVVTEPWYEFVEGNPTAQDIRFGAWSAILSGAAGHTYGGGHVWLAHTPESPMGGGPWPLEEGFTKNTLNYPGAISMGHLATFFKKTTWWKLAPHPEIIHEYPDQYCLASPGQEYIIYLRWAGGVRVDLKPSSENETFEYCWFDPDTGKSSDKRMIKGGGVPWFSAPGMYPAEVDFKDWVLHIRKKS